MRTHLIPLAIITAGVLIAGAIAFHATRPAYALTANGQMRLNVRSGEITLCMEVAGDSAHGQRVVCSLEF